MNVPNLFGKFVIFRSNIELCRQYGGLEKNFHPQVSVHPHEIPNRPSIISAKKSNVFYCENIDISFYIWNEACDIYHNQKYCISHCGHKSFHEQWIFYKHHLKITTLCVQHHAQVSIFDNELSKILLQVGHQI